MKMNYQNWSEEDDAKLREMSSLGVSFGEIGQAIGRTRNSVIGRAHRIGVVSTWVQPVKQVKAVIIKPRARRIERPLTHQDNKAQPRYAQPEASTTAFGVPRGLLQLEPHHCRFPVSGERTETMFCCADRDGAGPYCVEHRLLAWRPTTRQLSEKV